ncbi:MAG: PLP-dependent aminotransferase family protein [bacterium]|nr:PLP-dependent aminotransferase family protein [bacterium]
MPARERLYSDLARRPASPALAELFKLTERPDVISFAGGFPSPDMFLPEEARAITRRLLAEEPAAVLGYSPTPGFSEFREFLAARQSRQGMAATGDEILVTSGALQGLDLLCRVFLDRGDRVVVESPTYLGALTTLGAFRVELTPVPLDENGLDTARLAEHLEAWQRSGRLPKLLYTVPTFQNPSGLTLSIQRRRHLLELAEAYGFTILEDNAYGELRFDGDTVPTLKALDRQGVVVYLGTLSKVLSPGIRIGWIHAEHEIIERAILLRQGMDQCSNSLGQLLALEFGRRGLIERQIRKTGRLLAAKAGLTLDLLAREFPAGTAWTKPEGGFYTWVTLPGDIDTALALTRCIEEARVAYVAGSAFYAGGGGHNQFRLCYSQPSLEEIRRGVPRLAQTLAGLQR